MQNVLHVLELFCMLSLSQRRQNSLFFPYFPTEAPQAQAMAPLAYEDATAPPAYVYYGSGAAAQTSAPSNLHDSYNNPTYQANPPENVYAMADNSVNENKQKGNY